MLVLIVIAAVIIISYIIDLFSSTTDKTSKPKDIFTDDSSEAFYEKTGFGDLTLFKKELIERKGPYCEICGQTDVPLQVDHIIPVSRGGTDDIDNMQLLCYECHLRKHNFFFDEIGYSKNREIPEKYKLLNWAFKTGNELEIKYKKFNGSISKRRIKPLTLVYYEKGGNKGAYYIRAFCYLRNEERIFKVSRILSIKKIKYN